MHLRLLPICVILALLAACGGPDTKPLLAASAQQAANAEAAIAAGRWSDATAAVTAARQALGGDLTLKADDGRALEAHWSARATALTAAVRAALPRLGEAADRQALAQADALIAACADQALDEAWKTGPRAAIDQRLAEAEAAAKAEAERKLAHEIAAGYVLVMPTAKDDRDASGYRKHVTELLQQRFAPVPVVVLDRIPSANRRCGGIITIDSTCERVDYGGPTDIHGQGIPVAMETTITVRSRSRPIPLDGAHSFQVRKATPDQVSMYQLTALRREQAKALAELTTAKLAEFPALDGAAAIAERLAAEADAPLPPAWRLQASFRVPKTKASDPTLGSSSYKDVLAELSSEVQKRLGGAPLVEDPAQPAPGGTVVLLLNVEEAAYGSSMGMIKTVNGLLPIAMSAQVTITPAGGRARSGSYRAAGSPEAVGKGDLGDTVRSQRKRLGGQLATQIAADKELGE